MKKRDKYLIGLLILTPLILFVISGVYFFDLFGYIKNIYHLKNNLVIKSDDVPLLKDTIGYLINVYTIIITGVFSYYIYKSGEKSRRLAEEIKDKEFKKDRQEEIEKVFKVFYTLVYNIEKIILNDEEKKEVIRNEILLEDNFIKELSVLSTILNKDEIIKIYNIYKNIIIIKNNNKSDMSYKMSYETIIKEIVMEEILNMKALQSVKLEYALNSEYYDIFNRIYKKQFSDNNEETYGDRKIVQGEKTAHNGTYRNGQYLYETLYNGKNKVEEKILYSNGEEYRNGKYLDSKFEGYSKEFIEGKLVYEGYYQNDLYEGTGKKIDSNKIYEGQFLKGKIISGKYQDPFITFNGIFKNGRPFNGEGERLVKDDYNHVNYWEDLAWEQQEENQEEEPNIDIEYERWMMKNDPNLIEIEREYAKIKIKNAIEELDEKTIEKRLEFEQRR